MNGKIYPDLLERMAQFELTLLDWAEEHKGARKYVAFADKCWPAFPEQFGFEPCYVNSRLARLLSTVCSVTAMAICAPTLLRARFCLLLPVPFAVLFRKDKLSGKVGIMRGFLRESKSPCPTQAAFASKLTQLRARKTNSAPRKRIPLDADIGCGPAAVSPWPPGIRCRAAGKGARPPQWPGSGPWGD